MLVSNCRVCWAWLKTLVILIIYSVDYAVELYYVYHVCMQFEAKHRYAWSEYKYGQTLNIHVALVCVT